MDITFIGDNSKFLSGMLQALAAQISLEMPGVTVLSKCDMIKDREKVDRYVNYFDQMEGEDLPSNTPLNALSLAIKQIIDSSSLVTLRELNVEDEDTVNDILLEIDNAIQYGENREPDDRLYEQADELMQQRQTGFENGFAPQ